MTESVSVYVTNKHGDLMIFGEINTWLMFGWLSSVVSPAQVASLLPPGPELRCDLREQLRQANQERFTAGDGLSWPWLVIW